jgi:hypothetical protein
LSLPGTGPQFLGHSALSLAFIPTEISRLPGEGIMRSKDWKLRSTVLLNREVSGEMRGVEIKWREEEEGMVKKGEKKKEVGCNNGSEKFLLDYDLLCCLHSIFFDPEYRDSLFLRNVGKLVQD